MKQSAQERLEEIIELNYRGEYGLSVAAKAILSAGFVHKDSIEIDEGKIMDIFSGMAVGRQVDDKKQAGCWKWAYEIDKYDLAKALSQNDKQLIKGE